MEHYKANMDFLGKQLKPIFRKINEFTDDDTQQITWNEKYKTFFVEQEGKKIYMQSIYNQKREVANIVANKPVRSKVVVIFSMINIYLVKEICKTYKEVERIIIVEPSVKFFKHFISRFSLMELLNKITDVQISFVLSNDIADVEMVLKGFLMTGAKNPAVFASLAYQNLYPYYFKELCQLVKDSFITKQISENTATNFRFIWQINTWRNMSRPIYSAYILQNLFRANTCVIVSAGPSLQKNIHLIKELKEKAIVFAVGSAINILQKNDITPHFIVGVDGGELNNLLYSEMLEQKVKIPLLLNKILYHNVVKQYQGPLFEFSFTYDTEHTLAGKYFYKKDYLIPVAEPGFSVANVIHRLLLNLGCKNIIFMGQDMCFVDKFHSKGSWSESVMAIKKKENLLRKKDIYDQEVYTTPVLWGIKEGFEISIDKMKEDVVHWNATEGGLEIIGAKNKKLQEILEVELCAFPKRNFAEIIDNIIEKSEIHDISDTYLDSVQKIKEFVEKIKKINEKQQVTLQQSISAPTDILKYRKIKYLTDLDKKMRRIEYFNDILSPVLNMYWQKLDFANKGCYSKELLVCWQEYLNQLALYINIDESLIRESLENKEANFVFKEV